MILSDFFVCFRMPPKILKTKECELCGERVRKIKWKDHVKEHVENQLPCPDCSNVFSNAVAWHTHAYKIHSRPLKCQKCPTRNPNLFRFLQHVRHAHEIQKHVCKLCNEFSTNVPTQLQAHIRKTHLKEFRFFCDTCSKGFHCKTTLREHINTHTKEAPHQCDKCGETFRLQTTLRAHMAQRHPEGFSFFCEMCNKGFFTSAGLVAHARLHDDEDRLSCPFCCKQLMTSASFKAHVRRHTGECLFRCTICDRSFSVKKHLNRHMQIHSRVAEENKNVYVCSHCNRGFASVRGIGQHLGKCKKR